MPLLFIITALIIAIVVVIFAVQNSSIALVSFLMWQFQGSLAMVLLLTFVLGFMTGLLVILPKLIRRSLAVRSQRKKLEESQKIMEQKEAQNQTKI